MKIKNNNKIIKTFFFGFFLLFLSLPLNADFTSPVSSGYELELKLNPEYPSAQQIVSAQIELYGLSIEKYEILWFVNGVLKERGVGQKEFFFQTGNWGKITTLAVQVNTTNNGQIQKQNRSDRRQHSRRRRLPENRPLHRGPDDLEQSQDHDNGRHRPCLPRHVRLRI